eukprot:snap_masked-scaffold_48-processed-gene-1.115-mRNA-1 protein AED:1.00 eAED:1.00 QI:0/-1/0/0/-1/1/1/0/606
MENNLAPMLAAFTVGAAFAGAAYKFVLAPKQQQPGKSKKKKRKNKKKKPKDTPKQEKKIEKVEKKIEKLEAKKEKLKSKIPQEPVANNEAASDEVKEEPKKKKKKKRKKKKKPKPESDDAESEESSKPIKVEKVASLPQTSIVQVVEHTVSDDEGWETIPIKSRKVPAVVQKEEPKQNKNAKKAKKVLNLGDYVTLILGQGGKTIQNISAMSNAKINVSKQNNQCTITGDEDEVEMATQMITSLISNQAKEIVTVSSRLDKAILSKADTKQKIREISGAKLEFKFETPDDSGKNSTAGKSKSSSDVMKIVISGETGKVKLARELITDLLAGKGLDGNPGIKRVEVNAFQARIVIGQRGEMINKLQKESGSSINVEFSEGDASSRSGTAIVSVIGGKEEIDTGVRLISEFLAEFNCKGEVDVDKDAAKGVFTKLNELRKENPRLKVDVDGDRILLTGSESGVKNARKKIVGWIKTELGPPKIKIDEVLEEIELGSAVGKVIGKNRSNLDILEKEGKRVGAKIVIKRGTVCYVYGKADGVKILSLRVKEIVEKHENLVELSQKAQEELMDADWLDRDTKLNEGSKPGPGAVADVDDWGGFKLCQAQGW